MNTCTEHHAQGRRGTRVYRGGTAAERRRVSDGSLSQCDVDNCTETGAMCREVDTTSTGETGDTGTLMTRPQGELGSGGPWKNAYEFRLHREPVGPGGVVLSKTRATDKPDGRIERDPKVMPTWTRLEKMQYTYNFLANRVLPRMRESAPEKAEQVERLLINMQSRVEHGTVPEAELMPLMEGAVTAAEASADFKMEDTVAALDMTLDSVSKEQLFAVVDTVRSDLVRLYNMLAMVLNEMILVSTDTTEEVTRLLIHGYENDEGDHARILSTAEERQDTAWVKDPPRLWSPKEAVTRVGEMGAAMVTLANTAAAIAEQAPLSLTQAVTENVLGVGTKERGLGHLAFSIEAVHGWHAGGGLTEAVTKAAREVMSTARSEASRKADAVELEDGGHSHQPWECEENDIDDESQEGESIETDDRDDVEVAETGDGEVEEVIEANEQAEAAETDAHEENDDEVNEWDSRRRTTNGWSSTRGKGRGSSYGGSRGSRHGRERRRFVPGGEA